MGDELYIAENNSPPRDSLSMLYSQYESSQLKADTGKQAILMLKI